MTESDCQCCHFGNHTEPCTCDGTTCCHRYRHRTDGLRDWVAEAITATYVTDANYRAADAAMTAVQPVIDMLENARVEAAVRALDAEAQLSHLRAKANEMLQCDGDKTATAGIRATMGQILLELLDEAQRAATTQP